jgi:hypothetical protein
MMITLNSDEAMLPNFNHALAEIQTWRTRYSKQEYPQKVMINTFYRQHTVNFMWDFLCSPFNNTMLGRKPFDHSEYFPARDFISQKYIDTKLNRTQPVFKELLIRGSNVGGLDFKHMAMLVSQASKEAIEEIEFTYLFYAVSTELLFRWSACGMIGHNKSDAFTLITGCIIDTVAMKDYATSVDILGKIGASTFLKRQYHPFPSL